MGDHTETVSIDFDPSVTSYDTLLRLFWGAHRCERNHPGRQYRNAIFYRNDEQKEAAEASRDRQAEELGISPVDVQTDIERATIFTYAEGYHQNYLLTRHRELRDFLEEVYPDVKDYADSAVATRLNAWLGSGWRIDREAALEALETFGLPERIADRIGKSLG